MLYFCYLLTLPRRAACMCLRVRDGEFDVKHLYLLAETDLHGTSPSVKDENLSLLLFSFASPVHCGHHCSHLPPSAPPPLPQPLTTHRSPHLRLCLLPLFEESRREGHQAVHHPSCPADSPLESLR